MQDLAPERPARGISVLANGGTASSFDLGQAPVQSESNFARRWITASWVGCSPNDRAQSTGRKRHVTLCFTGSCSTRSSYSQPHPGRRVRAPWGWWRVPRRWRLPRRRCPSWEAFTEAESMPVAWAVDTASRVARVTGEGIIHVADTDTARRRWGPQRLVPRPTAPTALTTTATTRTATISAPASIDTDTRRAHADGGWAQFLPPSLFSYVCRRGFYFQSSLICVNTFGRLSISL